MSLESEINQKVFSSEQSKVLINLIYTYNVLKSRISEVLKEEGLTMQQYNVLRIVLGSGETGITTSEIRNRMLDKMCDASRMVDRLASGGLVEKIRDRIDRRMVMIHLTEQGHDLTKRLIAEQRIDQLVASLNEESARLLNEQLDALRDLIAEQ